MLPMGACGYVSASLCSLMLSLFFALLLGQQGAELKSGTTSSGESLLLYIPLDSSRILYPGAGLLCGSRTFPQHLSLHQAVPPSWTAVLMPVDSGCPASACAIQLCCSGLVVPSRQHLSQQSPMAGDIHHISLSVTLCWHSYVSCIF